MVSGGYRSNVLVWRGPTGYSQRMEDSRTASIGAAVTASLHAFLATARPEVDDASLLQHVESVVASALSGEQEAQCAHLSARLEQTAAPQPPMVAPLWSWSILSR